MSYIAGLSEEIIEILEMIQARIDRNTDYVWTCFNSIDELLALLNNYILRIQKFDKTVYKDISYEFGPTSTFQELSISNGWGKEFLDIASRFDALYEQITKLI